MKIQPALLLMVLAMALGSCSNQQDKEALLLEQLAPIDQLLSGLAAQPERFTASTDEPTILTGSKGTIIHLDPDALETLDGSPLGGHIAVALLELTDVKGLLLHQAPTQSNGQLLVSGGAYYLNMTSSGKQLRLKEGRGLDVEFLRLTEEPMEYFTGNRSENGQINWMPRGTSFKRKELARPVAPKQLSTSSPKGKSDIELILGYIDREPTKEELEAYKKAERAYQRREKVYKTALQTYESIVVAQLGWINCDRFYDRLGPRVEIQLLAENDVFPIGRIYAIFEDINSVMSVDCWDEMETMPSFKNLPIDQTIQIIGLAFRDQTPLLFEQSLTTTDQKQTVVMDFEPTTPEKVQALVEGMNRKE